MPQTIKNWELRANKFKYELDELEKNIDYLCPKILVNTQKLTPEFCIKYILNEEYMSCEEEKYLLTYSYVLYCQPHITRQQLEDAEDAFDQEKDLEKELHRLQRDLNSSRLQTYNEGDNSEEEKARQRERTSKIIRMNEVLALLNEIEIGKENKMTGESEGERKAGMDEEEDYIEAKTKALEKSLKDKTISETQRKRDEKELALFKGAEAKKPTTRKAPVKKAVVKKAVAKKTEVKKEVETPAKPKADHKKLVAKLKAKKGDKEYDNRASVNVKTGERYKRSESSDKKREALPLGKRVSADGSIYYENRLNRGDLSKKDKFEDGGEVKSSDWGLNLNW